MYNYIVQPGVFNDEVLARYSKWKAVMARQIKNTAKQEETERQELRIQSAV